MVDEPNGILPQQSNTGDVFVGNAVSSDSSISEDGEYVPETPRVDVSRPSIVSIVNGWTADGFAEATSTRTGGPRDETGAAVEDDVPLTPPGPPCAFSSAVAVYASECRSSSSDSIRSTEGGSKGSELRRSSLLRSNSTQDLDLLDRHSICGTKRALTEPTATLPWRLEINDGNLQKVALAGYAEIVSNMIKCGASINAPMKKGDGFVTLLHELSSRPDLENAHKVMAVIVESQANLNARCSKGATPLASACEHKHFRAAEVLLEHGAFIPPVDDKGRSALMCAVSLDVDSIDGAKAISGQLVALLASKSADLNKGTIRPPLLEAILQTNRPAVTALIAHGAEPRFLHKAVDLAPPCIINDLLMAQANPVETDSDGKTVLDVAFLRGDEEITTMLRDFIGDLERHTAAGKTQKDDVTSGEEIVEDPADDQFSVSSSKRASVSEPGGILGLVATLSAGKTRTSQRISFRSAAFRNSISFSSASLGSTPKVAMAFAKQCDRLQNGCRWLNKSSSFQVLTFVALITVLFFPDLWVVSDMKSDDSLDVILVLVLCVFFAELVAQTIAAPRLYINSFFFWTDVVGLSSVMLDLSMVSKHVLQSNRSLDNALVMRAVRTARFGARAGRFTKLVKLLRFLPGVQQDIENSGTAKRISNVLMLSLSTRISCLIILMIMILPLFEMATYPADDYSMDAWVNALDFALESHPNDLSTRLHEFEQFYRSKNYYPYEVRITTSNGTLKELRLNRQVPVRSANRIIFKASSGSIVAAFDFGPIYRVESSCNMVLVVVVIFLMISFSLLLSTAITSIVLRPLEELLSGVRRMAGTVFRSISYMAAQCPHGSIGPVEREEDDALCANETQLLEKVIDKLAALNAITKKSPIETDVLGQLGDAERAVLEGVTVDFTAKRVSWEDVDHSKPDEKNRDSETEIVIAITRLLEESGVSWGELDSWTYNALDADNLQRHLICLGLLVFQTGAMYRSMLQQQLAAFVEAVALSYGSPSQIPYHNWSHAVDVTHFVFRLLSIIGSERFMSSHERYALIVSATCHDAGHPGFNNPFLVETSHELAIRYNDHSPLENMHCAKLFELSKQPKMAIFSQLDKQVYREVRQVCVEAILHTDNMQHFTMVKELQVLYELKSEMFDAAMHMHQSEPTDVALKEVTDFFADADRKGQVRNMVLHFSDISNPTKPFDICKRWAWLIVDEFFSQGDREKELGITVQPLNDREKVNKPYSQVGFIEFFVAPLVLPTVRLFAPLAPIADQLISNLNTWSDEWIAITSPAPPQEEVAKLQDRIMKLEAKFAMRDCT
mmetsp:Transcript_14214/g.39141  ORF Transcript_14214/g.39141 Transcript_14214/m.39141 type:complete len:1301 (+) Transcript_14214:85-3987(+)